LWVKRFLKAASLNKNPKAEIRWPKEGRNPKFELIAVQTSETSVFAPVSRHHSTTNTKPSIFGF